MVKITPPKPMKDQVLCDKITKSFLVIFFKGFVKRSTIKRFILHKQYGNLRLDLGLPTSFLLDPCVVFW